MKEMEVEALFEQCSNWGRWGENDELGTLNYITQQKRVEAAKLVHSGRCVGIGRVAGEFRTDANPQPPVHRMLYVKDCYPAYVDSVEVAPHGWATTHIDALGHFSFNGRMYNGRQCDEVVSNYGLNALSIAAQRHGVFTRGVLLDVARALKTPALAAGQGITVANLEAAERLAGLTVSTGDAVFVRAGQPPSAHSDTSPQSEVSTAAGLLPECIPWLHERQVAVYSGDCQEVRPSGYERVPEPLHQVGLVSMGLCILDVPDVEALAAAAATENRSEFLLTVAPVPFPRATGMPVNPLCIF